MKLFIILATIAVSHGAKLENAYLPPTNARTAGGSGNFLQTPLSGPGNQNQAYNGIQGSGFTQQGDQFGNFGSFTKGDVNFASQGRPERPRASLDRNAAILRLDNNNDGETFSYAFETDNGIYAEESGVATNGVEAQGGYSYTGDDGQVYSVRYTADQNGFVPQGDHLPTPPPVPEEILKALEQNARDEAAGIYDDGSYNEGKNAQNYNGQFQNTNSYNGNDQDSVVTNAAYSGTPYNAPRNYNTGTFNANAGNTQHPTGDVNVPNTRNSPVQRAYLPPLRGQNRSGPRRQGFNSRSGYNY